MPKEHPICKVIVSTTKPGYWGKSDTIDKAIRNAEWIGPGDEVRVAYVNAEAYVDEMGTLWYENRVIAGTGKVRMRNGKFIVAGEFADPKE